MPNMVVPANSQPMFSMLDVVLMNHALGRSDNPFAGFEKTIYPNTYVLSSPVARAPSRASYDAPSRSVVMPEPEPEAPRSSPGARSLWPQLR
jgi:hypothetical protein